MTGARARILVWIGAAAAALVPLGCAGPGGAPDAPANQAGSFPRSVAVEGAALDPATLARVRALEGALADGDEDLAGYLAGQLRLAAAATGNERLDDLVDGFERVIEGRRLVRRLDLGLETAPEEGTPGLYRIRLDVVASGADTLLLNLPPGTLRRLLVGLEPTGLESRVLDTFTTDAIDGLVLEPGVPASVDLALYALPPGRALAVRDRWTLELRSGDIVRGDEAYPAVAPAVRSCEREGLASFLPPVHVEPAELVAYLQREEEPHLPSLLERAVRIAPERRAETLELLVEPVRALARTQPERIVAAAPVLVWLTRTTEPGVDPLAWSRWLDAWRVLHRTPTERVELDLPGDGR